MNTCNHNNNKKPIIFLIHGIRAKDLGISSMKELRTSLLHRGYLSRLISYGYVLLPISNRRAVEETVRVLDAYANDEVEVILIGYSNGAWTAVQAAEIGCRIDRLFLISPALHKGHAFPEQIKTIDVFYSETDNIVRIAKWRRRISNWLPWRWGNTHEWGEMGRTGYIGDDPRVINHDMGDVSHTFYKHEDVVDKIAKTIVEKIENEKA